MKKWSGIIWMVMMAALTASADTMELYAPNLPDYCTAGSPYYNYTFSVPATDNGFVIQPTGYDYAVSAGANSGNSARFFLKVEGNLIFNSTTYQVNGYGPVDFGWYDVSDYISSGDNSISVGVTRSAVLPGYDTVKIFEVMLRVRYTRGADVQAPTGSFSVSDDAANPDNRYVVIANSISDNSGMVSNMRFSTDGSNWSSWESYAPAKSYQLPSLGSFTIYVQYRDASENVCSLTKPYSCPSLAVEQPAGTNLVDGSALVGFGGVGLGSASAPLTFTVRNASETARTGLFVTADGANAADFVVGNLGATVLDPDASTIFTVTFSPNALGTRTATIHIAADEDKNPFDISLTGFGGDPARPNITTDSPLPVGKVCVSYNLVLGAVGGATPYTWSLDSGDLPSGLELSSAGVISGTPSFAASASFTIQATGNDGGFSTKIYSLAIVPVMPGDLDFGFGTGGKVTTLVGSGSGDAQAISLQLDGKTVVAGYVYNGNNYDFALARYNTDGTLDTGFGLGGKVTTPVGSSDDYAQAMSLQGDGKIVVAGHAFNGANTDFALARYNTNGALDTTFGTGGKVMTPVGSYYDYVYDMSLQSDGKIVLAGSNNGDIALVRYNTNGTVDTSFNGGKVTTPVGSGGDYAYDISLQLDGKIVVAGYAYNGTDNDFALVRYNTNGTLDTGFGTGGKVMTPVGSGNDNAECMALQSDGKIVVAGGAALVRYNTNGTLDASFGIGGKVSSSGGNIDSISLQSDGKIVVAGYFWNGTDADFAVLRYNPNGTLDTTFGTDGRVTTPVGSGNDYVYDMSLQSDGKIVVAGRANGTNNDFALVRYWGETAAMPAWRVIHFGSTVNSGDGADLNDFDHDGLPNLLEYAFGTDPKAADEGSPMEIRIVNGWPVVETPAQDEATLPYADVRVLGSTNLIDWTLSVVLTNGASAGREWHKPETAPDKAFFKLEAELKE